MSEYHTQRGMKKAGMPSRECPEATKDVSAMAKGHVDFIPPQSIAVDQLEPGEADNSPETLKRRTKNMNAKKAKALRREIYGDTSLRIKRQYTNCRGFIENRPDTHRARYQAAKREA